MAWQNLTRDFLGFGAGREANNVTPRPTERWLYVGKAHLSWKQSHDLMHPWWDGAVYPSSWWDTLWHFWRHREDDRCAIPLLGICCDGLLGLTELREQMIVLTHIRGYKLPVTIDLMVDWLAGQPKQHQDGYWICLLFHITVQIQLSVHGTLKYLWRQ